MRLVLNELVVIMVLMSLASSHIFYNKMAEGAVQIFFLPEQNSKKLVQNNETSF